MNFNFNIIGAAKGLKIFGASAIVRTVAYAKLSGITRFLSISLAVTEAKAAASMTVERYLAASAEVITVASADLSSLDDDAQVWLDAGSVVDSTEQSAINDAVLQMKSDGIWNKFHYHWVNSATSLNASLNDLKGAYNLIPVNSPDWTADEIKGNGTTMYLRSTFVPDTDGATLDDYGYFVRIRTAATSANNCPVGVFQGGVLNSLEKYGTKLYYGANSSFENPPPTFAQIPIGTIHVIRSASDRYKLYINGVLNREVVKDSTSLVNIAMSFLAENNSPERFHFNGGIVAGGECTGLSAAEVLKHHNILVTLDANIKAGGR